MIYKNCIMAEVLQNLLDKFNRMEKTEKKVSELEDRQQKQSNMKNRV